ncbi:porin, partial [Acinetobacter baumannii]
ILLTGYAPALVAGSTFNPDFKIWQVGSRTAWTPVKNLTLSGEVLYTTIDQSSTGGVTATAAGNAGLFKPAGNYEFKDQGILSGSFRVRR